MKSENCLTKLFTYKILDKKFVGNTWKAIISKTAIDQLIFPLPILGSFYIFLSALEGKTNSIDEVMEECNVKLWVCITLNYMHPSEKRGLCLIK